MEVNKMLAGHRTSPAPPSAAPSPPRTTAQHNHQQSQQPKQEHPPPRNSTPSHSKPPRPRKKEHPLLQRAPPPQAPYPPIYANYTPTAGTPHAQPSPQPAFSTRPAPPLNGVFRASGPMLATLNGQYNGSVAPLLTANSTSPQAGYFRRMSSDKVDYLADVASHHAQGQPPTRLARSSISREAIHSPSLRSTPPVTRPRTGSIIPSPGEIPMSDSPTVPPRKYTAPSLSPSDLQAVSDLTLQLSENSYLYDAHIRLIDLLHQGFLAHIFPLTSGDAYQEPYGYPLLPELRQARLAMDSRFPVGERLWIAWLQDECILAMTVEDRVAVAELCQKAVQEEVGSAKLWRLYGDWMWLLYRITHNIPGSHESNSLEQHPVVGPVLDRRRWTEDEKTVGREVFSWNPLLDVWIQGMKAVEWHMDDGNLVWEAYVQILNHDLARNPSPDKVKHVWTLFADRLQKPHASWQETFQGFSQFVSANYDESIYEDTMVAANKQSAGSKHEYELRQEFESRLRRAEEAGDQAVEGEVMAEYLDWESNQIKRKTNVPFALDLYVALLERANIRFPTTAEWWEDHVDLIMENPDSAYDLLSLVHRASRHCPWSGNLWTKHLLAYELAKREFVQLEDIKHRATNTGLLEEIGGMDELIKVYIGWCGYLRRRALLPGAGEDEGDVAEMGIRSVIENVRDIGARKYGKSFKGDPLFRAEKMYIKFLAQTGRIDEARDTWAKLIATHGDMYDFWDRYYLWEMAMWGVEARSHGSPPEHATRALRQAARRPDIDQPEKIIDLYVHHCAQHETLQQLQEAYIESRKALKLVNKRRAKEAADAAAQQIANKQEASQSLPIAEETSIGAKRKREDEVNGEESAKRSKSSDLPEEGRAFGDESASATAQAKRDRENTTVMVKNLPQDVTETGLRKFFRDCGDILTVQIVKDSTAETSTATIEFSNKDDVLAAQTRDGKSFEGRDIEIQVGTDTTLWVTNYPPEADAEYLRDLFKDSGEIVSIRFPSLKFNTHRRFCYIQFLTADQAHAATRLHGSVLGKNLVLQAKISNPTVKGNRSGPMQEGREVYVGNLHWSASEKDVEDLFKAFGTIESVRIPRNLVGKSKGTAFVVFPSKSEAEAAVKEMNLKQFKGRALNAEISVPMAKGAKRNATTIINAASASPEPSAASGSQAGDGDTNMADLASPASGAVTTTQAPKDHHARTLLLRNIPDTVNDARIQALTSKYGSLRKVTLRPEKREAMVEFEDIKDVGKAELGLQDHEIDAGVHVQVGRLEEQSSGRLGSNAEDRGPPGLSIKGKGTSMAPAHVRRPGQGGVPKRGGRGGLGFRRGGSVAAAPTTNGDHRGKDDSGKETNGQATAVPAPVEAKSNADFRAMLKKE